MATLGLRITPDALELQSLVPGVTQTFIVTIKNVDKKTRTVRVRPPKSKYFSVTGFPQSVKLPPGLEQQFQVVFNGEHYQGGTEAVSDRVIIQADNGDIELPLRSVVPKADVVVAGDLMFGLLPMDSQATKVISIVNKGTAATNFKIDWDRSTSLQVAPAAGQLAAYDPSCSGHECQVSVSVTVQDAGAVSGEVTLLLGDSVLSGEGGRKLVYSATVVKQGFELLSPAKVPLHEVDFGPQLFGEEHSRTITLLNNGPIEAKYFITYGSAGEMRGKLEQDKETASSLHDPDNPYADLILATRQKLRSKATNDNPFTIDPLTGTIPPFTQAPITFKFAPKDVPRRKGFVALLPAADATTRIFDFVALIEFPGCPPTTRIKLPVKGKGMATALKADPMSLVFGDVPTHGWADQLLMLHNTNTVLPVAWRGVKQLPYFNLMPSSGTILAGQTNQVMVRYQPKALGSHSGAIPLQVTSEAGGIVLQELQVAVEGSSLRVGSKASLVGGTDKLPADFIKEPHFLDDDQIIASKVAAHAKSSKAGVALWERPDLSAAFSDIAPGGTLHALGRDEFATVKQHKSKATEDMRARRTSREKAHLLKKVDDSDVNLGMDCRSGLVPFVPPPTKTVDPLWTVGSAQEGRPKQQRVVLAADLEGIPLHKDRPQGEVERLACCRELSKDQIAKLVVGPKVLDFGRVSVGSCITQQLLVVNGLDSPVHLVLDLASVPELRGSKNSSQVIPAGSRARFPVTLTTVDMRSFQEKVDYCINGSHVMSFAVAAQVVPVTLELSSEELHFEFSLNDWEPYLEKLLLLNNPHPWPVHYSITSTAPNLFSVTPGEGSIKARSSADLLVRWTPPAPPAPPSDKRSGGSSSSSAPPALGPGDGKGAQAAEGKVSVAGQGQGQLAPSPVPSAADVGQGAPSAQEGYLVLQLVGGDHPRRIFVQGQLPEGSLRLKDKALDAGYVPLATPQSQRLQLRNTGTRAAAFRVLPNAKVKVTPEKCKVAPEETVDLEVNFSCPDPGPLTTTIELQVQGGRLLRVPFKAVGVVPHVQIDVDEFNFGQVFIGASAKLPFVLTNTTPVPAKLVVDLVSTPSLQLLLAKDAWSSTEYDQCPLMRIGVQGQVVSGSARAGGSASNSARSSRRSSTQGHSALAHNSEGCVFHILLNPSSQLPLTLFYRPSEPGTQVSELAVADAVASGARGMQTLRRVVTGEAVKPRLVISKTAINFGTRTVIRSNQVKAPYSTEVFFTNHEDEAVVVTLGALTSPDSSVFGLTTSALTVNSGEMVGLTITFCPRDGRLYETSLPLFLDGSQEVYMSLELSGQGQHPRLVFDVRECLLPPVPLGVPSSSTFHILNNGYDNLELRFRLPADESHLPLRISFPEGNLVGLAKAKLPVVVSFEALKPVSFTASIDFLDEDGKRYSIPVSAAADNCLLTHYSFMQANVGELRVEAADPASPVRLLPCASPAGYQLPHVSSALGSTTPSWAIVRFLNATTGRLYDEQLHKQLVESRGKVLAELVEVLSGKQLPGKVTKFSTNKKEAAEQLLAMYDAALAFLRAHGGLLNAVKPEMLLPAEDLARVLNTRANQAEDSPEALEAVEQWGEVEFSFATVSVQAWNSVISQLFKVFVLGRVTLKSLASLPGMPTPPQGGAARGLPAPGGAPATQAPPPPPAQEASSLSGPSPSPPGGAGPSPGAAPVSPSASPSLLCPADSSLLGSNLYSVAEACLLAWASAHYAREFGAAAKRVTNFGEDLRDGLVLFSLLAGYWPAYGSKKSSLATAAPVSADSCHDNAELVIRLMKDMGLPFDLVATDISQPDPKEMMVLLLYLYQTLPQFMPRTTIQFSCRLGETQAKDLELSNPARKAIAYTARLEGSSDFSMEATIVRIDAKGMARTTLKCSPTTSIQQEARLVLMSKRDGGGAHAATLVFLLRSLVNTRAPLKRVRAEGPVYEMQQFEVVVTNPFMQDCEFSIQLLHEPAEPLPVKEPEESNKKGPKRKAAPPAAELSSQAAALKAKMFPAAFALDRSRLRLKQNGSEKVRVSFLPFWIGTHYCTLLLRDKDAGSFAYELVGEAGLPAPCLEAKGVVPLESAHHTFDLFIPWLNPPLEAAKRTFLERHPGAKDRDQVELLKRDPFKTLGEAEYSVSQTNSLVSCSDRLVLSPSAIMPLAVEKGGPQPGKLGEPLGPGVLRLALKPLGTGIYPARVLLTSTAHYDVRVVDLELTAQTMVQQFELQFECAVRQSIMQEVPLVNTSDQFMAVSATLSSSTKAFAGQREVSVPPGATVAYPLQFRPLTVGAHEGLLELSIPSTGEKNQYRLQGKALDPVAESHVIVECQARKPATKTIVVPNIAGGPTEYTVLSDLDCISGSDLVKLPSTQAATYKLTVAPSRSGVYVGSLSFRTAEGQYVWYSVEVRASEPPEVAVIHLQAQVRTALAVNIPVVNPLDEPLVLAMHYSHPSLLLGPQAVTLPPRTAQPGPTLVQVFYSPLLPGKINGSLMFVNEELGEFWYELVLEASPAPPLLLPPLRGELGKRLTVPLRVSNPLEASVVILTKVTNLGASQAFSVSPPALQLGPMEEAEVQLQYSPASLASSAASPDQMDQAVVVLDSVDIGTWEYHVQGCGDLPSSMDPVLLSAALGGATGRGSLVWHNPFPLPTTVRLSLSGPGATSQEVQLLTPLHTSATRADGPGAPQPPSLPPGPPAAASPSGPLGTPAGPLECLVPGEGSVTITLGFTPKRLHSISAQLTVSACDPRLGKPGTPAEGSPGGAGVPMLLSWRYPIQAIAEVDAAKTSGAAFRFRCKARTRLDEPLALQLAGLASVPASGEMFSHELVFPPNCPTELSQPGVLRVEPAGAPMITAPHQPLQYRLNFCSPVPLAGTAELVVSKASGGRWRFELQFSVTEADSDGVLVLEAAMGQTSALPVWLFSSSSSQPQAFTATFTADTPLSFDVRPASGLLPVRPPGLSELDDVDPASAQPMSASVSEASGTQHPASRTKSGLSGRGRPVVGEGGPSAGDTLAGVEPPLSVMYTCKDFGKVLKGRLLVATNDSQYSFELVGRMPSYVPPKTQDFKASIDNKLSAQLAAQLALASSTSRESGRPNFVAANVKRTRGR